MESVSFKPIISCRSKLLILGTMPGLHSLKEQKYYAHNRNAFWFILFKIFNEPFSINYQLRIDLILKNELAVWDTLKYCYREGSLDSKIRNAEPNNIEELLIQFPQIKNIIFNGKAAEKYYDKFNKRTEMIKYFSLPSTSPANATLKIEDKLNQWAIVRELI